MNKTSLVIATEEQTGQGITATTRAVDAALRAIVHALANGEKVTLPGIGVLEPDYREARTGRNPATGEALEIPAKIVVKYRAADRLKLYVNAPALVPQDPARIALTGTVPQADGS